MNYLCGAMVEFKTALESPSVFVKCILAHNHRTDGVVKHHGRGLKGAEIWWTDGES